MQPLLRVYAEVHGVHGDRDDFVVGLEEHLIQLRLPLDLRIANKALNYRIAALLRAEAYNVAVQKILEFALRIHKPEFLDAPRPGLIN